MKTIGLSDIDLLDIGNTIQLYGAIFSGKGQMFYIPMPDEDESDLHSAGDHKVLSMGIDDWQKFLSQSDNVDVIGVDKAILRKCNRQIDQKVSWAVYKRDGYACRYCNR